MCGLLCPSSASNAFDMLISNSESRHRLSNNAELIGDNDDNMFGSLSSASLNTLFNLGGAKTNYPYWGYIFNNHVKRATNRDKQCSLKLSPSTLLSCQASVGFLSSLSNDVCIISDKFSVNCMYRLY